MRARSKTAALVVTPQLLRVQKEMRLETKQLETQGKGDDEEHGKRSELARDAVREKMRPKRQEEGLRRQGVRERPWWGLGIAG